MRCCHRPSSCGSPLSSPLPKDRREEKAEPVARQVAGSSSLASGTRVLSQNSSAARCFCSMSIPNGDGCRCPRGGRLSHRASTHDLFRYRKFHTSKKRSCLSRVVPPPLARLRHATLQACGHRIKAQKRCGVQQLLGIFQGNSTSPASHDCPSRTSHHWEREGLCFLCLHGAMVKNTKAREWLKGRFCWEERGGDGVRSSGQLGRRWRFCSFQRMRWFSSDGTGNEGWKTA